MSKRLVNLPSSPLYFYGATTSNLLSNDSRFVVGLVQKFPGSEGSSNETS